MDSTTKEYKDLNRSDPYYILIFGFTAIITGIALTIILSLLFFKLKTRDIICKSSNKLYVILLWADLLSILSILISWINTVVQYNMKLNVNTLCNLNSFLTSITVTMAVNIMAVNIMAVISLQRCLVVVFKNYHSSSCYIIVIGVLFLLNVANGVQININNVIGIYPIVLSYSFNSAKSNSLIGSILFAISGIISYLVILVCYITVILYKRCQSKNARIEIESGQSKNSQEESSSTAKSVLIIFISIVITGIYIAMCAYCWLNPEDLSTITDMIQFVLLESQIIVCSLILLDLMPSI